jgi:arylsulfatase A-like enzyme
MRAAPIGPAAPPPTRRAPLAPRAAILLAISFGLAGGYLDLVLMLLKRTLVDEDGYFRTGRDFPWTVPVGHALFLMIPGGAVAAVNRRRPGAVSMRAGTWLFATLAIWGALLRLPLYGACTLLLGAGLARPIGGAVAVLAERPRRLRYASAGLLAVLAALAGASSVRQAVRESGALAGLPAPPANAPNVVLIVWDTVSACNLSLHGYPRDTSPNLARWARRGVRYDRAVAPAPWTYPSHSCFFTGRWPYQLNSQWTFTFDAPDPTLAEYLAARGYQAAGFAGNTAYCSYETGLDRGFLHFEDYPLTPRSFLGRTAAGSWLLLNVLDRIDPYARKWLRFQARDARGINDAFFDWLGRRRRDRPFFAFLNEFDAHDPYVPPPDSSGRFGIAPRTPQDFRFLREFLASDYYGMSVQPSATLRQLAMARDCYDDCIAFLDDQLGRLLGGLAARGLLDNTVVIITSDHGEAWGDHGLFSHRNSVYLEEVAVPLVVLAPGAPAGRAVSAPVTLRDLPATVVDLLGLSDRSPFPGRSLAAYWSPAPGSAPPETTPALSELAGAAAFRPQHERGLSRRGFQMSLVAQGRHYLRDGEGVEQLYDLERDPFERTNVIDSPEGQRAVGSLRQKLLEVLTASPGSIEVERAYLKPYRQWLMSLVETSPPPRDTRPPPERGKRQARDEDEAEWWGARGIKDPDMVRARRPAGCASVTAGGGRRLGL